MKLLVVLCLLCLAVQLCLADVESSTESSTDSSSSSSSPSGSGSSSASGSGSSSSGSGSGSSSASNDFCKLYGDWDAEFKTNVTKPSTDYRSTTPAFLTTVNPYAGLLGATESEIGDVSFSYHNDGTFEIKLDETFKGHDDGAKCHYKLIGKYIVFYDSVLNPKSVYHNTSTCDLGHEGTGAATFCSCSDGAEFSYNITKWFPGCNEYKIEDDDVDVRVTRASSSSSSSSSSHGILTFFVVAFALIVVAALIVLGVVYYRRTQGHVTAGSHYDQL